MIPRVLLADDRAAQGKRLERLLQTADLLLEKLRGKGARAWERLARWSGDLILVSRPLLPDPLPDGLRGWREIPDRPEIVVLVEREDPVERARLLAAGCYAVLYEGLADDVLQDALLALIARRREEAVKGMTARPGEEKPLLSDFISASPRMKAFLEVILRVASSDATLLISGETGVGKEHLARAIHSASPRSSGPFIAVNCASLPESLLESELFGHQEGAFTGASRQRRGWFELAHRGSIFLDEIGELPPHLQVKFLNVLDSHQVKRIGAERSIAVDVRVLAATNRNLVEEVQAERFRQDLYYRLSVVTLEIPPLRERREDIPGLIENYIRHFHRHLKRPALEICPLAVEALCRYSWPGNVRELINIIERAVLLCPGSRITLAEFPETITGGRPAPNAGVRPPREGEASGGEVPPEWLQVSLRKARRAVLEQFERSYLTGLLRLTGGRIGETARKAEIDPRSLFGKMRRYGLRKEDYR